MALSRTTSNKSFFLPVQSEFTIRRLPNVEFFCQRAVLPGMSMRPATQYNPFVDIKKAGDVVLFNEFQVTFLVDEWLTNYMSVAEWLVRLGFPEQHSQYLELSSKPAWSGDGVDSDCSIMFLDSRGKPRVEAVFENAFPTGLTDIIVDSTAEETRFTTATATFAYTKYNLVTST